MYVVEHYRHSVTRRFREANISGNDGFKDLCAKEAAQVGGDLLGKGGSVVVHGEKNAFDGKRRIYGTTEAHKCVQKLRDAFEG